MKYQIILNGSQIFSGDLVGSIFILVIIGAIFYAIIEQIRIKLAENETLKYEFITIIAHKFRTPLTATKWILEEMSSTEQDPHRLENLNHMRTSNEKLITLTGTLIEMTNPDKETKNSYKFEIVDLCEFVRSIADAHKDLFHKKNIFFAVQCSKEKIMVSIDRPRMEFVLQTILENAINYTPTGRNVNVGVGLDGKKAVFAVTDQGIGIDKSDIGKIFTKFFRTKNARLVDTEGFGVGLFLAQSVAKRHHGKISVYSNGKDQGSTFIVRLPAKKS